MKIQSTNGWWLGVPLYDLGHLQIIQFYCWIFHKRSILGYPHCCKPPIDGKLWGVSKGHRHLLSAAVSWQRSLEVMVRWSSPLVCMWWPVAQIPTGGKIVRTCTGKSFANSMDEIEKIWKNLEETHRFPFRFPEIRWNRWDFCVSPRWETWFHGSTVPTCDARDMRARTEVPLMLYGY